ncbi:acyl carrier protein [Chitinophagaceae bacterium LB-8]|uniref:Acyl carrier protein n=1 Tax=Paraflavisolibacter caeni TaxID=2982496 RepID=A0A9X2XPQ2_9BACT|nr:acyl carrier protein [Paraflavisolibacter caeni]MCU7551489.1 acyl carrier protein [Paraflavisolibacter caeni]
MERVVILSQVQDIFKDILDDEEVILTDKTQAPDVKGWDSLTHIQLVVGIERHFKIRFTSREIQSWNNVGEMVDTIQNRIQNS